MFFGLITKCLNAPVIDDQKHLFQIFGGFGMFFLFKILKLIFSRLCYWFESGVPDTGPLKNEWNWPFSRPRCLHRLMAKLNLKLK